MLTHLVLSAIRKDEYTSDDILRHDKWLLKDDLYEHLLREVLPFPYDLYCILNYCNFVSFNCFG